MQKVTSLVSVEYTPFLKRERGAKLFYKDLVIDYRERFVSEGVRGPIYHDDPNLKKGVYRVPEVFAYATLFVFSSPENTDRLVVKTIYDYSPLLYSRAGIQFLKEKTLPSTFDYDVEKIEQSRRPAGLISRFYLCSDFELDLLRALNLDDALPNSPYTEEKKLAFVEQVRSSLEHHQFCPSKIEPETDISDRWDFFAYVSYDDTPPEHSDITRALESLVKT